MSDSAQELPTHLVLFDGDCAVCDAGMLWLMDHDPDRRLSYAPLQGTTAAEVLSRHPELPPDLDSMILVQRTHGGERLFLHSDAVVEIAVLLPAPWSLARHGAWVPRPLRNAAYRTFARWRYRLFGRKDQDNCRLPSEDEVARMLP